MKPIPVLFLSYHRINYTKQSLEALLKSEAPIEIYIHDNGSGEDVKTYLKEMATAHKDKIKTLVFSESNIGLNIPFNTFIRKYKDSEFIGKVDNDTIIEKDCFLKLYNVMKSKPEMDVLGAFMQRPPSMVDGKPWTFQRWVDSVMRKEYLSDGSYIAHNSYAGGTGVLIRMSAFWKHGILYEKCGSTLGDFTPWQRAIARKNNDATIGWLSSTIVKLLNIKEDGISLTNDYEEYDNELAKRREEGNKFFKDMGGLENYETYIQTHEGRERLTNA